MKAEHGVALITAILVVALVTSVIAGLVWQNETRIRQMENQKLLAQADAVERAAVDWARTILAEDAEKGAVDHPGEIWASPVAPIPAEGGEISGGIADQGALFNLNNLAAGGSANEAEVLAFQRLLGSLRLPVELANALADWIDTDSSVRHPGGAEDMDYLSQEPPCRAANQPLTDVNSLYRIRGFTPAVVDRLRPFVTALPAMTKININTAPREVLQLSLEDGTTEDAESIIHARSERAFDDRADFSRRLPLLAPRLRSSAADFGSQFFLVETRARFGKVKLERQTLLRRNAGGWPVIVWRKG